MSSLVGRQTGGLSSRSIGRQRFCEGLVRATDPGDAEEEFRIDRFAWVAMLPNRKLRPVRRECGGSGCDAVGVVSERNCDVDGVLDEASMSQRARSVWVPKGRGDRFQAYGRTRKRRSRASGSPFGNGSAVLVERYETRRIFSFDERRFRAVAPLQGGALELLPADS